MSTLYWARLFFLAILMLAAAAFVYTHLSRKR